MLQGLTFLLLCLLCLLLAFAALFRMGAIRLESPIGRRRDGLRVGRIAPEWEFRDVDGQRQASPNGRWQVLVFADNSIVEFPGLIAGVRRLIHEVDSPDVLWLPRTPSSQFDGLVQLVGEECPVVPVPDDMYLRYEVRVVPFVTVLDPEGVVRMNGVVNYEATLMKLWREARTLSLPQLETLR